MEYEDVLHGRFTIPWDVAAIIETKYFRRLKKIHQLGLMYVMVKTISHTRYEHCIGTYRLAQLMLEALESAERVLIIPEVYRKAVLIAALLHDVGHGPFSHSWEAVANGEFKHEENALPCIDAIFGALDSSVLACLRENNNYGISLIKALILGEPKRLPVPLPKQYRFLFEIVNNKQCGLDVDKWDYLQRDYHYMRNHFELDDLTVNFDDLFLKARVSHNGAHIEYGSKDLIASVYELRQLFHHRCYRHPKFVILERLLYRLVARSDAKIANKKLTQIDAHDIEAFLELVDDKVMELISDDAEYKYIERPDKLQELHSEDIQHCQGLNIIEYVDEVITPPGRVMPADEKFCIYDLKERHRPLYRDMQLRRNRAYYVLLP